jgi:hypothetical protein
LGTGGQAKKGFVEVMRGIGQRPAVIACLVGLLALLASVAAGSAAAGPAPTSEPPTSAVLDTRGTTGYWTAGRLAGAQPLDLAGHEGEAGIGPAAPEPLIAQPVPLASTAVDHPARYPNRVHGKLFGHFDGLGDYSCSATVISSRSESLILTAGHCIYDAGGTNQFATHVAFVPGYSKNTLPYGYWNGTNAITTSQWVRAGALDYDLAFIRLEVPPRGTVQSVVGSRGIGFNQPRKQRLAAYGYPAQGAPNYDGDHLIRCESGYVPDPFRNGGPRSRGMHCDQKQGASGGGWVSQDSFVVSNTSHGYPRVSKSLFFGPYFGRVAKALYRSKAPGWPSAGPISCAGRVASIAGTDRGERIVGTTHEDVIATLGGDDVVKGRGGDDVICGGSEDDQILAGGGRDRVFGGSGTDRCGRPSKGNRVKDCE